LDGLSTNCRKLSILAVDNNVLSSWNDVDHLVQFSYLWSLRFKGNPLSLEKLYRLQILFKVPHLMVLDGFNVGYQEKVAANNKFDPPNEVIEALLHSTLLEKEASLYTPLLSPEWGPRRMKPNSLEDWGLSFDENKSTTLSSFHSRTSSMISSVDEGTCLPVLFLFLIGLYLVRLGVT
jgi:hypothetical protein